MLVLVADDDATTRAALKGLVKRAGHEVTEAEDGEQALHVLTAEGAPRMALLDWDMPKMTGLEVCTATREKTSLIETYLILITSHNAVQDVVQGLAAGANDYIKKPFEHAEITARLGIGSKVMQLHHEIRILSGLLPICAWCKKIRDESQQWVKLEEYVANHSEATFTHGICRDCREGMRKKL